MGRRCRKTRRKFDSEIREGKAPQGEKGGFRRGGGGGDGGQRAPESAFHSACPASTKPASNGGPGHLKGAATAARTLLPPRVLSPKTVSPGEAALLVGADLRFGYYANVWKARPSASPGQNPFRKRRKDDSQACDTSGRWGSAAVEGTRQEAEEEGSAVGGGRWGRQKRGRRVPCSSRAARSGARWGLAGSVSRIFYNDITLKALASRPLHLLLTEI